MAIDNNNIKPELPKDKRELEQDLITWRREQVLKYISRGLDMNQIAKLLHVDPRTIYRDRETMRQYSRQVMQKYLSESIPFEMMKFLQRQNDLSDIAWYQVAKANEEKDIENLHKFMKLAHDIANTIIEQVTNNKALVYEAEKAGAFDTAIKTVGELKPVVSSTDSLLDNNDNTIITKALPKRKGRPPKNNNNNNDLDTEIEKEREDAEKVF